MSDLGKVAVLGLGAMGLPMAVRLATSFSVQGFDPDPGRMALARAGGVSDAASAIAASEGASAVLVAVRDARQLRDVLFSSNGIARVLAPGAVIILTSTVGVAEVRSVAAELAQFDLELADAPLSGGPKRAGSGELLIVVGGSPSTIVKIRPILDHLASTLLDVGEAPGDAQAFKTVNQLLCGIHIAAAAEALALAGALGLKMQEVIPSLNAGAAASFMLGDRGPRMLQVLEHDEPEVLSRVDIFVKDMGIVTAAAKSAGVATPLASAAEQTYLRAQSLGLGASDDSSVIRLFLPNSL